MKTPLRIAAACAALFVLPAPGFADSGWIEDFDQGLAKAKAENKPALVDFTGSDWCIWCKRLDQEIFSQAKFKDFVKDKYVLIKIDFPQTKPLPQAKLEAHQKLAEKYQVQGFPSVLLMDGEGKVQAQLGHMEGGPDAFIAELEKSARK
jgi:protein disulfide-isomerase